MSDPNIPPPPGGTPPPPPPPPGGTPPPPPPPPPPPGGTPPPPPPGGPGGGGYGAPPPPPGGFGGGGYGAPPPTGGTPPPAGGFEAAQLDLGASLQYGWKKFTDNAGPLLVLMLVIGVVAVVVALIIGILQAGASVSFSSSGSVRIRTSFGGMLWNIVLQAVFALIISVLGSILLRAVLGLTRGVAISSESVLKMDNLVPFLITMAIVWVVPSVLQGFLSWIFVGLGLLMFPIMVVWAIVMGFAPLIALDTGSDPIEALKKSMEWVTGDIGTTGVIVLVTGIVSAAGVVLCIVGLLASIPVGALGMAYAYRARNSEMVAV